VKSPHLDLLDQVWNDRDQLDLFAAWTWQAGVMVRGEPPFTSRPLESFLDRGWARRFSLRHPGYGITYAHDPYHGGSNPLHLGHCLGAFDTAGRGQLLRSSSAERRAVLILDRARGWYNALQQTDLPDLGQRSWHVDVVVRPLGWLGSFRKSRETGRWFAGKHSVHMLGFR
jgi:hypothetical protein